MSRVFIDEMSSVYPPAASTPASPTDAGRAHRLELCFDQYIGNLSRGRNNPIVRMDSRERNYKEMVDSDKQRRMTVEEIIYSETPVLLELMDWGRLAEIVRTGHRDIRDTSRYVCKTCKQTTAQRHSAFCLGRLYCLEHLPNLEMCARCLNVKEDCTRVQSYDGKTIHVCASCLISQCRDCSRPINAAYAEARRCAHCIEQEDEEGPLRRYSHGSQWMGDELGTMVQSKRVFSCEVEGLVSSSGALGHLAETLPRAVGISTDGSIHGRGQGIELQSPKLRGARGEELVSRISASCRETQLKANDSCGMHIHLDGRGIVPTSRKEYPKALVQLWLVYLLFEDVILSLLPFSRRLNTFCRPMRDFFKVSEVEEVKTPFDLEKLWYKQHNSENIRNEKGHGYHPSRYFGVNLHSLLGGMGGGNLEIRYHSGTTRARKILHWVNLHSLIMDAAQNSKFAPAFFREAQALVSLRDKTDLLFSTIGLNEKSCNYFNERQRKFSNKSTNDND